MEVIQIIEDPVEQIAKIRGSIPVHTESPLQMQWRGLKQGDTKTFVKHFD